LLNLPGRGPKCYRAATFHPGGIPVATFSFGCASCRSHDPGAGARATHASRRPPGGLVHGDKDGPPSHRCRARTTETGGTQASSEETIFGQELSRDGFAGIIAFQRGSGSGLKITRLSIAGEEISRPGEQCQVEVVAGTPIQTRFAGRPNGLSRYEVEIETCPFSLDVLEGAVLVTRTPRTCDFRAADCRVGPAGLWGPPGNTIGPDQTKQLERERCRVEATMLAKFHALLTSAGKDKEAIKQIASEQARFSSEREVICRNYLREDIHGFCALRITQARALALRAAFKDRAKARAKPAMAKKKPASNFKLNSRAIPSQTWPRVPIKS
jgi:hypothetical protein